jgi:hypothetical protein
MKNLLLVVIAAALGFGGAYLVVSQKNESRLAALRSQLASANAAPAAPAKDSPADILLKLAALDPTKAPNRPRAIRLVIFGLESLVNDGNAAVGPISDFFVTGQDVDYTLEAKFSTSSSFWDWHPGQPVYSGLVLPPSLRLSLVDVLRYIGGPQAEAALVTVLKSTTHAVEVAYIGQVLEKIAPGKYTSLADAMAKKVLAGPAVMPATFVESKAETYLYAQLNSRGDTSVVATAQSKLAQPGVVDTEAAEFLATVLKQQAVPALALAYTNASDADKGFLVNLTARYVGVSPDANNILTDWILNNAQAPGSQSVVGRPRAATILGLAGVDLGPLSTETPTDPAVILGRIAYLDQLDPQTSDPRIKQAIAQARQKLVGLTAH